MLCYNILLYATLYYTILYYTILYYTTILYYAVLYYVVKVGLCPERGRVVDLNEPRLCLASTI